MLTVIDESKLDGIFLLDTGALDGLYFDDQNADYGLQGLGDLKTARNRPKCKKAVKKKILAIYPEVEVKFIKRKCRIYRKGIYIGFWNFKRKHIAFAAGKNELSLGKKRITAKPLKLSGGSKSGGTVLSSSVLKMFSTVGKRKDAENTVDPYDTRPIDTVIEDDDYESPQEEAAAKKAYDDEKKAGIGAGATTVLVLGGATAVGVAGYMIWMALKKKKAGQAGG